MRLYNTNLIYLGTARKSASRASALHQVSDDGVSNHFAKTSLTQASDADALVVLDGAGLHGRLLLTVRNNISHFYLAPDSQELKPVQQVWLYLRHIIVLDGHDHIVDARNFLLSG